LRGENLKTMLRWFNLIDHPRTHRGFAWAWFLREYGLKVWVASNPRQLYVTTADAQNAAICGP
jgi:hypothetical protein